MAAQASLLSAAMAGANLAEGGDEASGGGEVDLRGLERGTLLAWNNSIIHGIIENQLISFTFILLKYVVSEPKIYVYVTSVGA